MNAVTVLLHIDIVSYDEGCDLKSNREKVFSCFFESDKVGHEVWSRMQSPRTPTNHETTWIDWIDTWISSWGNWLAGGR
jgi:hypothetical protein